jgi:hypothetical protein
VIEFAHGATEDVAAGPHRALPGLGVDVVAHRDLETDAGER